MGEQVGVKTSTAFVPPELAAILFKPTKESIDEIKSQLAEKTRQYDQAAASNDRAKQRSLDQEIQLLESQQNGQGAVDALDADPSFDVWSFGAVLYEVRVCSVCALAQDSPRTRDILCRCAVASACSIVT